MFSRFSSCGIFRFVNQVGIIVKFAKETGLKYEVPTLNLTIQGMLAHLISTRQKQIDTEEYEYLFKNVYTRLQEPAEYGQMVVGYSGSVGFFVCHHNILYNTGSVGIAALWGSWNFVT